MFNWLWERIHVQERIQKGGHKCALWIFGQGRKKKGPGCLLFCAAAPCCARTEKNLFPLTTERSRKVSTVPKLRR